MKNLFFNIKSNLILIFMHIDLKANKISKYTNKFIYQSLDYIETQYIKIYFYYLYSNFEH